MLGLLSNCLRALRYINYILSAISKHFVRYLSTLFDALHLFDEHMYIRLWNLQRCVPQTHIVVGTDLFRMMRNWIQNPNVGNVYINIIRITLYDFVSTNVHIFVCTYMCVFKYLLVSNADRRYLYKFMSA